MPQDVEFDFPAPTRISPDLDGARRRNLEWARRLDLVGDGPRPGLVRLLGHAVVGRVGLPPRKWAALDLCADTMAFFFVFDDQFDDPLGQDPARVARACQSLVDLVQDTPGLTRSRTGSVYGGVRRRVAPQPRRRPARLGSTRGPRMGVRRGRRDTHVARRVNDGPRTVIPASEVAEAGLRIAAAARPVVMRSSSAMSSTAPPVTRIWRSPYRPYTSSTAVRAASSGLAAGLTGHWSLRRTGACRSRVAVITAAPGNRHGTSVGVDRPPLHRSGSKSRSRLPVEPVSSVWRSADPEMAGGRRGLVLAAKEGKP